MHLIELLHKIGPAGYIQQILLPDAIIKLSKVSKEIIKIIKEYNIPTYIKFNKSKNHNFEDISKYIIDYNDKFNITGITIHNCNISILVELAKKKILSQCKNITKIELCYIQDLYDFDCHKIRNKNTNKLIKELKRLPKLKELNLNGNEFNMKETRRIFNVILNFKSLEILKLHTFNFDIQPKDIFNNPPNILPIDKKIRLRTYVLSQLINLKELDISSNCFDKEELPILFQVLPKLKYLVNLNLSHVVNFIFPELSKIFVKELRVLTNLKILNISCNKIDDEDIDHLATSISVLTKLNNLNISELELKTDGFIKITRGLICLTNLQILNANNNKIDYYGLYYLLNELTFNCPIRDLNLSNNEIGKNRNLINVLNEINTLKLTNLDLSNNFFGLCPIQEVNPILNINTSLKYLNLTNNHNIISSYFLNLINNIQNYKSLCDLNLSYCNLQSDTINIIKQICPHINISIGISES